MQYGLWLSVFKNDWTRWTGSRRLLEKHSENVKSKLKLKPNSQRNTKTGSTLHFTQLIQCYF